ncbi:transcriptional regulator [Rhodococcoides corynebacterioides]|uniref:transcriptional regulator n=1 Tax=Rhodococcoides corynebacterioides TaxID=53972 RepID=UPI003F823319
MITYLSRGEIAERLGVTLDTIKGYDKKRMLPEPDAMVGRNQGWLPLTIDTWQAEREFDRRQREASRTARE